MYNVFIDIFSSYLQLLLDIRFLVESDGRAPEDRIWHFHRHAFFNFKVEEKPVEYV